MPQITLLAGDGDREPNEVVFTREEEKLTIACSCPEGNQGRICEHKVRLAANDHLMLVNPMQTRDLHEAHIWVIQSSVSDLILRLFDLRSDPDQDEEMLRQTEREIAAAMKDGS